MSDKLSPQELYDQLQKLWKPERKRSRYTKHLPGVTMGLVASVGLRMIIQRIVARLLEGDAYTPKKEQDARSSSASR